jgi:predicted amidohydrolase
MKYFGILLCIMLTAGCSKSKDPETPTSVRVAAIQVYSRMGEISYNRKVISGLIESAAAGGAKIVVLPECAVSGYMDPANQKRWTARPDKNDSRLLNANETAEKVPGASTDYFAGLAKKHGIYLCIALIEKDDDKLYNSQVLLSPEGLIIAHHRKKCIWTPGDGLWVVPGNKPAQVVDSPYGRLGLMVCYDYNEMPEKLSKHNADIVLYSVGWYGPNTENWYRVIFPRDYVVPNNFAIIAANWSAEENSPGWPGHGYSCIIDKTGSVLNMAKTTKGSEIVFADLPIKKGN